MKVAKAVSSALLATAALTAASTAIAIPPDSTSPTDLLIAVWNPTTNVSYLQDLGTPQSAFSTTLNNPAGFSTTWTVDGGNLATDLGAGLQFQVFADDYSNPTTGTYSGNTEYLSYTGRSAPPALTNGGLIDSYRSNVEKYLSTYLPGTVTAYKSTGNGMTGSDYWAQSPQGPGLNGAFTIGGWNGGAAANGVATLELVQEIGGSPDVASSTATASIVGTNGTLSGVGLFTLSSTGTLSFSSFQTAVPLPAAGWLLVSGLLGLSAVARRRKSQGADGVSAA